MNDQLRRAARSRRAWFGMAAVGIAMTAFAVGRPEIQAEEQTASEGKPEAQVMFNLKLRHQNRENASAPFVTEESNVSWPADKTAIIICDMWDDHWCKGAAERVVEMAPAMNRLVTRFRDNGALIIHAPSTCVGFYADTPARQRALDAPFHQTPVPLATSERWGTCWCWPDPTRETDLPIDDSDMGCDCAEKCTIREAWTRQISTIEIHDEDAITDNGQELYNLLSQHQIEHVAIMGVHLNMCVLGRPFGIRQLVKLGPDVALIRDMTDTMYDHRMRPYVSHFAGTDLVVDHVEKYWCPTFTSDQVMGGDAFRFQAAPAKQVSQIDSP